MRYFVVLDLPDDIYPLDDPFYAPGGEPTNRDPYGRSSLAGWIEASLDETYDGKRSGPPEDVTVYSSLDDLTNDFHERQGAFEDPNLIPESDGGNLPRCGTCGAEPGDPHNPETHRAEDYAAQYEPFEREPAEREYEEDDEDV